MQALWPVLIASLLMKRRIFYAQKAKNAHKKKAPFPQVFPNVAHYGQLVNIFFLKIPLFFTGTMMYNIGYAI